MIRPPPHQGRAIQHSAELHGPCIWRGALTHATALPTLRAPQGLCPALETQQATLMDTPPLAPLTSFHASVYFAFLPEPLGYKAAMQGHWGHTRPTGNPRAAGGLPCRTSVLSQGLGKRQREAQNYLGKLPPGQGWRWKATWQLLGNVLPGCGRAKGLWPGHTSCFWCGQPALPGTTTIQTLAWLPGRYPTSRFSAVDTLLERRAGPRGFATHAAAASLQLLRRLPRSSRGLLAGPSRRGTPPAAWSHRVQRHETPAPALETDKLSAPKCHWFLCNEPPGPHTAEQSASPYL